MRHPSRRSPPNLSNPQTLENSDSPAAEMVVWGVSENISDFHDFDESLDSGSSDVFYVCKSAAEYPRRATPLTGGYDNEAD